MITCRLCGKPTDVLKDNVQLLTGKEVCKKCFDLAVEEIKRIKNLRERKVKEGFEPDEHNDLIDDGGEINE